MKSAILTIVDYGVGNLYSVRRAFEACGASNIRISSEPDEILASDCVVLPGVGAFANGMRGLQERRLDSVLRIFAHSGRPLLGICLGMQLFATTSKEFGEHSGLNLIPGQVDGIPRRNKEGQRLKIPYVGWSTLECPAYSHWGGSLLASVSPEQSIYLVHSYHFTPDDKTNILATYQYGGHDIIAAIKKDNITGLQFHPEKSGETGLALLKAFVDGRN